MRNMSGVSNPAEQKGPVVEKWLLQSLVIGHWRKCLHETAGDLYSTSWRGLVETRVKY